MSKDKVRVYQLARELDVESKWLIDLLQAAGADVKNHMTTLDAETRQLAQDLISGKAKVGSFPAAHGPSSQTRVHAGAEPAPIPAPKTKRPSLIPEARTTLEAGEIGVEPPASEVSTLVEAEAELQAEPQDLLDEPEAPEDIAASGAEADESLDEPTSGVSSSRPLGPIPTPSSSRPPTLPTVGESGEDTQRRAVRPVRDRKTARPRPVIAAPPAASATAPRTEAPKRKIEPAAQKPVVRFTPEDLRSGQLTLPGTPVVPSGPPTQDFDSDREGRDRSGRGGALAGRGERQRRRGQRAAARRLIDEVADVAEDEDRPRGGGARLRQRGRAGAAAGRASLHGPVMLDTPVTVRSVSEATGVRAAEIQRKLMALEIMANINATLSEEVIGLLSEALGMNLQIKQARDAETIFEHSLSQVAEQSDNLTLRPPVVTFMGHVDHGKTSLMDRIRSANVAARESGGITQHIGAYQIGVEGGAGAITFLDTPGHEAFTAMRARGANVTDVVVLVVAADDGVMPQTQEAISHAKAADVTIVVAMNKVDLPTANIDRLKQQLSQYNLIPEEWGGDTLMVPTSAATGEGVKELLEAIALVAELKELTSDPTRPAVGMCLEASLSEGRGVQATMLVRSGTLRRGDVVLCGSSFGRVRAMVDEHNQPIEEAGASKPVILSGLDAVPAAGEKFHVVDDVSNAREIAEHRSAKQRIASQTARQHISLEGFYETLQENKVKELVLVLKADVRGSLEAIRKELSRFDHKEVRVNIIHEGVGAIVESDVLLADASDAIVIGFHVVADDRAQSLANEKGVEIRRYDIIYKVSDDIRLALEGMLAPETREVQLGRALVQETFAISRVGVIAGCRVVSGTVERNSQVRVIRDGTVIGSYGIESLRRVKDDVREVREGLECGIKLANYNDIKRGDLLESFRIEQVKRTL